MVYFLYDYDRDLIKIGVTNNLNNRMTFHRWRERTNLYIMGVMPGVRWDEQCLHDVFGEKRAKTAGGSRRIDWYKPHDDLFRFINKFTTRWDGSDDLIDPRYEGEKQTWSKTLWNIWGHCRDNKLPWPVW
jgi:hypothetical protein